MSQLRGFVADDGSDGAEMCINLFYMVDGTSKEGEESASRLKTQQLQTCLEYRSRCPDAFIERLKAE